MTPLERAARIDEILGILQNPDDPEQAVGLAQELRDLTNQEISNTASEEDYIVETWTANSWVVARSFHTLERANIYVSNYMADNDYWRIVRRVTTEVIIEERPLP